MSQFNRLPPELITLILSNVSISQLLTLSRVNLFPQLNQSFWRQKIHQDFQVADWYFDLDPIAPGYLRYIEVSSQFRPTLDSLSKPNQFGFYDSKNLFGLVIQSKDCQLIKEIGSVLIQEPDVLGLAKQTFQHLNKKEKGLWFPNDLYNTLSGLTGNKPKEASMIERLIENKYWDGLSSTFAFTGKLGISCLGGYLIYRYPELFEVVQKMAVNIPDEMKVKLLRIAAQIGDEEKFNWIASQIENPSQLLKNYKKSLSLGEISFHARRLYKQDNHLYNPLYDAYIGANPKIIQTMVKWGLSFESDEPVHQAASMAIGREFFLSNPISVYQLIDKIELPPGSIIDEAIFMGIEIVQLLNSKFPGKFSDKKTLLKK